jgi:hypothetical protein
MRMPSPHPGLSNQDTVRLVVKAPCSLRSQMPRLSSPLTSGPGAFFLPSPIHCFLGLTLLWSMWLLSLGPVFPF